LGEIYPFSGTRLIVWQTPAVHEKIKKLIDNLRKLIGDQIAIETRFLLVDENFLEDIGIDSTITFRLGSRWNSGGDIVAEQGSYEAVIPGATSVSSSLGGQSDVITGNPALNIASLSYDGGALFDDLTVSFIIRATQMHANSKMLTAPRLMVLNGESAMMSIQQQQNYISNKTWNSETVTFSAVQTETVIWADSEPGVITTGISLSITPTITADKKYVLLYIMTFLNDLLSPGTNEGSVSILDPDSGEILEDTFDLPETQNTSVMTRVTVPDQGTVLLGGLTLLAEKEIQSGVPVLSKIPILGRLFENRSEVKDKQILLVLVKPTIVLKEEAEAKAIAAMAQDN
jgi:type II secretory pathway component GspD/PulD (secretin)